MRLSPCGIFQDPIPAEHGAHEQPKFLGIWAAQSKRISRLFHPTTHLPSFKMSSAANHGVEYENEKGLALRPIGETAPHLLSNDPVRERSDDGSDGKDTYNVADVSPASPRASEEEDIHTSGPRGMLKRHRRPLVHLFICLLSTGWWIASLILHRKDKPWVVPFLLWLAINLRLLTFYTGVTYVTKPIKWTWQNTAVRAQRLVPEKFQTLAGAAIAVVAMLLGAFVSEETADNTRANRAVSIFGLIVILFVFWATSKHRSAVRWRTVIVGMLAQYIIGLFVLRTQTGYDIFKFIADLAGELLGFAKDGVAFMVGTETANTGNFFWGVIPAIVFFISLVQVSLLNTFPMT